ncbi:MAG TPA: SDR family oxidoreductase [Anaerolineaceae bacterium]|nr:SDR family oxidoreductase [Anaerolineaceae bacterium]
MAEKVIVITGASSGIGAELARQLGRRGDKVVLAARREAELSRVAEEIGPNALAVVTDVTRRSDVERLRDEALRAFGRLDVWVNNAGRGITRPVLDLTDEEFDSMIALNTKAALYGMQAIAPYFKQRGAGHVINVSSMLGRVPFASYRSAYNAAKAALNSLTTNARMDLEKEYPNIHVSLVLPPVVTTEFADHALHGTPVLPTGRGPAAQSAEQVAAAMVELIDHPRPELYTSPEGSRRVAKYYTVEERE